MTNEWYFQANGRRFGPISAGLIKQQVGSGRILPETLVRKGGEGKWIPAAQVQGLFGDEDCGDSAEPPPSEPPDTEKLIPEPPRSPPVPPSCSEPADVDVSLGHALHHSASLSRRVRDVPQLLTSAGVMLLVLIGVVALWLLSAHLVPNAATREHPHWEYIIRSPDDLLVERELERLGTEGWELVFARRATSSLTDNVSYEMIFKRRRLSVDYE